MAASFFGFRGRLGRERHGHEEQQSQHNKKNSFPHTFLLLFFKKHVGFHPRLAAGLALADNGAPVDVMLADRFNQGGMVRPWS